jgi:hypothetical protein
LKFVLAHDKDQSMKRSRFSEARVSGPQKAASESPNDCERGVFSIEKLSNYQWRSESTGVRPDNNNSLRIPVLGSPDQNGASSTRCHTSVLDIGHQRRRVCDDRLEPALYSTTP